MTYFIHNGTAEEGPFTLDELRGKRLQFYTPVWHSGLSDWTPAGKVPELAELLTGRETPPPFRTAPRPAAEVIRETALPQAEAPPFVRSRNNSWWILAAFAAATTIGSVMYFLYSGDVKGIDQIRPAAEKEPATVVVAPPPPPPTYGDQLLTIEETERREPLRFLSASLKYRPNFWGNKYRIDGTIINSASVANFKDAVIRLSFLSDSGTPLSTEEHVIYRAFGPSSKTAFELKVERPHGSRAIEIDVVSAVAM